MRFNSRALSYFQTQPKPAVTTSLPEKRAGRISGSHSWSNPTSHWSWQPGTASVSFSSLSQDLPKGQAPRYPPVWPAAMLIDGDQSEIQIFGLILPQGAPPRGLQGPLSRTLSRHRKYQTGPWSHSGEEQHSKPGHSTSTLHFQVVTPGHRHAAPSYNQPHTPLTPRQRRPLRCLPASCADPQALR